MRADEPGGPAVGRSGVQVDHRHRGIAPVTHIQAARVRHGRVGAVPDRHSAASRERGRVDQIDRVTEVAHRGDERPSRQNGDAGHEQLRDRVGEDQGVGSPRRAEPGGDEPIDAVLSSAAHPHRVRAAAARPRESEPRGAHAQDPRRRPRRGIDAHHAVVAVAVVRHEHEPVARDEKIEGECADVDLAAGRLNAPARRQQRGAAERAGDETGRDQCQPDDGGRGEPGDLAHGWQYAGRQRRRHPLA